MNAPCGTCMPCKAGKRRACAHMLLLDAKDLAQLAKILKIVGENPGRHRTLTTRSATASKPPAPEPHEQIVCAGCGGRFAFPVFLAEFARSYRIDMLKCEPCRSGRQTRIDFDEDA